MSVKQILTGRDNPILRTKSKEVKKIDSKTKKLFRDLKDTLKANPGLGLAAPQIGENLRIILVKLNFGAPEESQVVMVNPEIISSSKEKTIAEEGCLSLPEKYCQVERFKSLTVAFLTEKNITQTLNLSDLNARTFQHEFDHLDGILIIDKAVPENLKN